MGLFKKIYYVLFDGSSHYVADEQDKENVDDDVDIVFETSDFEEACDKVDQFNNEIGLN